MVSDCLPQAMAIENNIFSENYTHSSWIIRFGKALFNMRDPIPIFDALVVSQ